MKEKAKKYTDDILRDMIFGSEKDIIIIKSRKEPHVGERNGGFGIIAEDWGYITILEHGKYLGLLSQEELKEIFYDICSFVDEFSRITKGHYKLISRKTALDKCKAGKGFNPELHHLATSSWFFVNELTSEKGIISDVRIETDSGHLFFEEKLDSQQSSRIEYSDISVRPTILGAGILAKKPDKNIVNIVPPEYPFFTPEGVIVLEKVTDKKGKLW